MVIFAEPVETYSTNTLDQQTILSYEQGEVVDRPSHVHLDPRY